MVLRQGTAIVALDVRCKDLVRSVARKNLRENILVSKVPRGDSRAGVLRISKEEMLLEVNLTSRVLYPISPYRLTAVKSSNRYYFLGLC
jgi:hypothetical protein